MVVTIGGGAGGDVDVMMVLGVEGSVQYTTLHHHHLLAQSERIILPSHPDHGIDDADVSERSRYRQQLMPAVLAEICCAGACAIKPIGHEGVLVVLLLLSEEDVSERRKDDRRRSVPGRGGSRDGGGATTTR